MVCLVIRIRGILLTTKIIKSNAKGRGLKKCSNCNMNVFKTYDHVVGVDKMGELIYSCEHFMDNIREEEVE